MKTNQTSRLFTAVLLATALRLGAAPVEEIDLSAADDAAEERAKSAKVDRTEDGYIDVTCDNATVSSVLQQFRRATHMNILSSDSTNLSRRVSASLYHVPWCNALQSILGLANFKMDDRDGIWYVSEKTPEEIKSTTRSYILKNASAVDIANLFNGIDVSSSYEERNSIRNRAVLNSDGTFAAPANKNAEEKIAINSAIAGRVKATAFPNTNTLVLSGTEANLYECEKIIRELDRPVTQVYIEARFIELTTEAMHKLGVQWDQLKSWGVTAKGINAGYESNDGKAANYGMATTQRSTSTSDNTTTSDSTTGSKSSSKSGGDSSESSSENTSSNNNGNRTASDNTSQVGLVPNAIGEAAGAGASAASMAWRNASTFSGQLSAQDFELAISAFEQMQEGKMFSNPRIIVANGKEARVDMTTKEPNVEVTSDHSGGNGQYLSVATKLNTIPGTDKTLFAGEAFFSYGISLTVRPRVSPSGLISVEVVPTISEKKEDKMVSGADSSAVYTTYPVINVKTINTEFSMKDGSTAVIGGLTQTKEDDVDSGIPYLRKIPWIGPKLFGWQSRQKVQAEILVLVTVGIANPETLKKDAGLPTNAVLGREYVEGRRLEPGERPDALKNIQNVDTRTLDQIRKNPYQMKDDDNAFDDDAEKKPADAEPIAVEATQQATDSTPQVAEAPQAADLAPTATEPAAPPPEPASVVAEPAPAPEPAPVAEPVAAEPVAAEPAPAPVQKKNVRRRH